jgi:hypothetical protein
MVKFNSLFIRTTGLSQSPKERSPRAWDQENKGAIHLVLLFLSDLIWFILYPWIIIHDIGQVHWLGKFMFKQSWTMWEQWIGAPSKWRIWLLLLLSCGRVWFSNMSRPELLVMMSSSKKNGLMILSCVNAHHTFTLGLSCSSSKHSFGAHCPKQQLYWSTHPKMWNFASTVKTIWLKKFIVFQNLCAHACCKLWSQLFIMFCKFLDYLQFVWF